MSSEFDEDSSKKGLVVAGIGACTGARLPWELSYGVCRFQTVCVVYSLVAEYSLEWWHPDYNTVFLIAYA